MKHSKCLKMAGAVVGFLMATCLGLAQGAQRTAGTADLGLTRLKAESPATVPAGRFAVDALAADAGGARRAGRNGAELLALVETRSWSRPLRGGARDLVFVSFSVYGSVGTIVEVGGAKLGVIDSEMDGYAQLAVDEPAAGGPQWRLLGLHVPLQRYDGQPLGAFSVLTVRLDRANDSWDLYQGARLLAEDLPLDGAVKHGQFVVRAGGAGAWVNGLVQSDDNPLYPDANGNGVDDTFEQAKKGRLLSDADTKADRKTLIADWRADQRTHRPPALFVHLPRPDSR